MTTQLINGLTSQITKVETFGRDVVNDLLALGVEQNKVARVARRLQAVEETMRHIRLGYALRMEAETNFVHSIGDFPMQNRK